MKGLPKELATPQHLCQDMHPPYSGTPFLLSTWLCAQLLPSFTLVIRSCMSALKFARTTRPPTIMETPPPGNASQFAKALYSTLRTQRLGDVKSGAPKGPSGTTPPQFA